MPEVRISAEPRTEFGKGAARRVRRADKVPAVLYGHGEATRHVALPGHQLMIALKGGSNQLLTLDLGNGDTELALPRQVVRDPIRGFFQHLDLLLVRKGEKVFADVSVHLLGEAAPDTIIDRQTTAISVEADATDIPSAFELDIDGITAGQHFTAAQVTLPAGVALHTDPDAVIVQGLAQVTAEQLEDELTPEDGSDLPVNDADEEPGEGDIVPDTESGEGGPTES